MLLMMGTPPSFGDSTEIQLNTGTPVLSQAEGKVQDYHRQELCRRIHIVCESDAVCL